jgi:hypothetical protein
VGRQRSTSLFLHEVSHVISKGGHASEAVRAVRSERVETYDSRHTFRENRRENKNSGEPWVLVSFAGNGWLTPIEPQPG